MIATNAVTKLSILKSLTIFMIFAFCYPRLLAEGRFQTVPELIQYDGYPVEVHHVTTKDGYIIEMHRIPHGRNEMVSPSSDEKKKNKPVALFSHCVMCSSAVFVVLGPTRGLAYVMANLGFDVWLMNARGTEYSTNHTSMSPHSTQFWKFSWHEQGLYDLPASIDYVLKVTRETQLDFIGYSMGTTQFFLLMCERPEYNKKIRNMIALAPAVFINNTNAYTQSAGTFMTAFEEVGALTGQLEIPPPDLDMKDLFSSVCKPVREGIYARMCIKLLLIAGGTENGNIDMKSLQFFFRYFPETTSLRSLVHYSQIRNEGLFCKYDFGNHMNMIKYGTKKPSEYNLSKVTAPVSLFWSQGDTMAPATGVSRLRNSLPNVVFEYEIPFKQFSHADYIWGNNAHSLVYEVVAERLKSSLSLR